MTDHAIRKKAEEMYVVNGCCLTTIYKHLAIPRTTLYRWWKKYDWDEKRKTGEIKSDSLIERVDQHIKRASDELDINPDPKMVLAFQRLVAAKKDLINIENAEAKRAKEEQKEKQPVNKSLSDEAVREIERKLFGMD